MSLILVFALAFLLLLRALFNGTKTIEAKIPMMAITTISSIIVNPFRISILYIEYHIYTTTLSTVLKKKPPIDFTRAAFVVFYKTDIMEYKQLPFPNQLMQHQKSPYYLHSTQYRYSDLYLQPM